MALEQQIEELRMELSACTDNGERTQIEAELNAARKRLTTHETMIDTQIA